MKVECKKEEFIPVTITLESQEEIDKLFAIFNYTTILKRLNLRDIDGELYQKLIPYKTIRYSDWHSILMEIVK